MAGHRPSEFSSKDLTEPSSSDGHEYVQAYMAYMQRAAMLQSLSNHLSATTGESPLNHLDQMHDAAVAACRRQPMSAAAAAAVATVTSLAESRRRSWLNYNRMLSLHHQVSPPRVPPAHHHHDRRYHNIASINNAPHPRLLGHANQPLYQQLDEADLPVDLTSRPRETSSIVSQLRTAGESTNQEVEVTRSRMRTHKDTTQLEWKSRACRKTNSNEKDIKSEVDSRKTSGNNFEYSNDNVWQSRAPLKQPKDEAEQHLHQQEHHLKQRLNEFEEQFPDVKPPPEDECRQGDECKETVDGCMHAEEEYKETDNKCKQTEKCKQTQDENSTDGETRQTEGGSRKANDVCKQTLPVDGCKQRVDDYNLTHNDDDDDDDDDDDAQEIEDDCKQTVDECKLRHDDAQETEDGCKCRQTVDECKQIEEERKETESNCKQTDECKERDKLAECKQTEDDCNQTRGGLQSRRDVRTLSDDHEQPGEKRKRNRRQAAKKQEIPAVKQAEADSASNEHTKENGVEATLPETPPAEWKSDLDTVSSSEVTETLSQPLNLTPPTLEQVEQHYTNHSQDSFKHEQLHLHEHEQLLQQGSQLLLQQQGIQLQLQEQELQQERQMQLEEQHKLLQQHQERQLELQEKERRQEEQMQLEEHHKMLQQEQERQLEMQEQQRQLLEEQQKQLLQQEQERLQQEQERELQEQERQLQEQEMQLAQQEKELQLQQEHERQLLEQQQHERQLLEQEQERQLLQHQLQQQELQRLQQQQDQDEFFAQHQRQLQALEVTGVHSEHVVDECNGLVSQSLKLEQANSTVMPLPSVAGILSANLDMVCATGGVSPAVIAHYQSATQAAHEAMMAAGVTHNSIILANTAHFPPNTSAATVAHTPLEVPAAPVLTMPPDNVSRSIEKNVQNGNKHDKQVNQHSNVQNTVTSTASELGQIPEETASVTSSSTYTNMDRVIDMVAAGHFTVDANEIIYSKRREKRQRSLRAQSMQLQRTASQPVQDSNSIANITPSITPNMTADMANSMTTELTNIMAKRPPSSSLSSLEDLQTLHAYGVPNTSIQISSVPIDGHVSPSKTQQAVVQAAQAVQTAQAVQAAHAVQAAQAQAVQASQAAVQHAAELAWSTSSPEMELGEQHLDHTPSKEQSRKKSKRKTVQELLAQRDGVDIDQDQTGLPPLSTLTSLDHTLTQHLSPGGSLELPGHSMSESSSEAKYPSVSAQPPDTTPLPGFPSLAAVATGHHCSTAVALEQASAFLAGLSESMPPFSPSSVLSFSGVSTTAANTIPCVNSFSPTLSGLSVSIPSRVSDAGVSLANAGGLLTLATSATNAALLPIESTTTIPQEDNAYSEHFSHKAVLEMRDAESTVPVTSADQINGESWPISQAPVTLEQDTVKQSASKPSSETRTGSPPKKKSRSKGPDMRKKGRTKADTAEDIQAWHAMLTDSTEPSQNTSFQDGFPSPNGSVSSTADGQGLNMIKGLEGYTSDEIEANSDKIVNMLVSKILSRHPKEVEKAKSKSTPGATGAKKSSHSKKKKKTTSSPNSTLTAEGIISSSPTAQQAVHGVTPHATEDGNSNTSSSTLWSHSSLLSPAGSLPDVAAALPGMSTLLSGDGLERDGRLGGLALQGPIATAAALSGLLASLPQLTTSIAHPAPLTLVSLPSAAATSTTWTLPPLHSAALPLAYSYPHSVTTGQAHLHVHRPDIVAVKSPGRTCTVTHTAMSLGCITAADAAKASQLLEGKVISTEDTKMLTLPKGMPLVPSIDSLLSKSKTTEGLLSTEPEKSKLPGISCLSQRGLEFSLHVDGTYDEVRQNGVSEDMPNSPEAAAAIEKIRASLPQIGQLGLPVSVGAPLSQQELVVSRSSPMPEMSLPSHSMASWHINLPSYMESTVHRLLAESEMGQIPVAPPLTAPEMTSMTSAVPLTSQSSLLTTPLFRPHIRPEPVVSTAELHDRVMAKIGQQVYQLDGTDHADNAVKQDMSHLHNNSIETVPSCDCGSEYDESREGPFYNHLGAGHSVSSVRNMMEERLQLTGQALRIEKVKYTGHEGRSPQGCPTAKWILRRSGIEEKALVLLRRRPGHVCQNAVIIVAIVMWEGLPSEMADDMYDYMRKVLPEGGLETERRCGHNDKKTCACQGWDGETGGASFTYGCSWSMYYNACKFAKSPHPRKFRLRTEEEEPILGHRLNTLATHIAPLHKKAAPKCFENMTYFENVASDCRLGNKPGRPYSGVTSVVDFCAHSHKDNSNMNNGCTAVLTLTKHRGLDVPDDEQLHVLPLYVLDTSPDLEPEPPSPVRQYQGLDCLSKYPMVMRIRSSPWISKKKKVPTATLR